MRFLKKRPFQKGFMVNSELNPMMPYYRKAIIRLLLRCPFRLAGVAIDHQPVILNRISIWLAVAVASALNWFPLEAVAAPQTLHGHVPAAAQHRRAIGGMAPQNRLNLAISLPLRNTNELAQLIRDLYDPASPRFHHYLTASEFAEQFGPTPADYQAVLAFAKANGFEIIGTHPNRTLVDVRAPVDNIEKTFHLHLNRYAHPT